MSSDMGSVQFLIYEPRVELLGTYQVRYFCWMHDDGISMQVYHDYCHSHRQETQHRHEHEVNTCAQQSTIVIFVYLNCAVKKT